MRLWRKVVGILFVASGTVGRGAAAGPLTLTRDGQPAAVIVLAEKPTRAAQFAALELRWHVKAISGAVLPIERGSSSAEGNTRIYIGDTSRARALGLTQEAFKLQEYAVRFGKNELVLVGKDDADFTEVKLDPDALGDGTKNANWPGWWVERSTLNAVYDFLQDGCGVRWLNPTDMGASIPRQPTLTVTMRDVRRSPTSRYRDSGIMFAEERYDRSVTLWGSRMEEGFKAWDALAYGDSRAKQGDSLTIKRNAASLFLLRMRNGGEKCVANHSLYHYYDLYWRTNANEAAAKYFVEKRPELFAQGYEGDEPPQMCYSSTSLVALVAQEARDYFDKSGYPFKVSLCNAPLGYKWGENFFCVQPMDNASFCKCPACQAMIAKGLDYGAGDFFSTGIYGDYLYSFVDKVTKEVKKTHPNKTIVTLAYGANAFLPRDVELDPSVAVQFCYATDGAPWMKVAYDREWNLAKQWGQEAKVSGRALYAWCYYGHGIRAVAESGNYQCFPGFMAHAISKELKLYKKYGYRGMFHCGMPVDVDAYVLFRLMDNADLDVDRVLDEYFDGLYGAAAKPLRKLYAEIEQVYGDPKFRPTDKNIGADSVETAWGYLGTEARMATFGKLMDEARRLASTDREKRNVALFDLATWQCMTQGRAKYVTRKTAPIPSALVPVVPAAGGELGKVAWDKAAPMAGGWYQRGSAQPADRAFSGRLAHDGEYLYIELVDPCATKNLTVSPGVACFDDWEFYLSRTRSLPYRHFLAGPTGMFVANSNGEVNWRMFVPLLEHGGKATGDTSAPDQWICRVAIPLKEVVQGGAKPGEKIYLNVVRVSGPNISGQGLGIDTWVPYTTVIEVDRSAEITLAK